MSKRRLGRVAYARLLAVSSGDCAHARWRGCANARSYRDPQHIRRTNRHRRYDGRPVRRCVDTRPEHRTDGDSHRYTVVCGQWPVGQCRRPQLQRDYGNLHNRRHRRGGDHDVGQSGIYPNLLSQNLTRRDDYNDPRDLGHRYRWRDCHGFRNDNHHDGNKQRPSDRSFARGGLRSVSGERCPLPVATANRRGHRDHSHHWQRGSHLHNVQRHGLCRHECDRAWFASRPFSISDQPGRARRSGRQ